MARIVVVDDSHADLDRLERLLSAAGHQVSTAENGKIALEVIKSSKPDIVLMDVNMPVMDGFAATRALKADAELKSIPVVLVTAKDQKADKAWGQMLGAAGYVTKPYQDADVLAVLQGL